MTKQLPTIVFFGSGPVAAKSLRLLHAAGRFKIEAVVTKPNPSHHRGRAAVIDYCAKNKLPFITPLNKSELTRAFNDRPFQSTIGIVIDYGIIIEQPVIDYFPHGIINSHFSLLPLWRGADPITFSILSGAPDTGVSLMRINSKLDEGPLLAQEKILIQPKDTATSLTEKLIQLSHDMLHKHLPGYLDGSLKLYEQQGTPTYSRKLTKADGIVDWTKPAAQIEREIRAYCEWPKSTAKIGSHQVILKKADVINTSGNYGEVVATKKSLTVICGKGALDINVIQPPGKKEMPVEAFLAGYPL